MAGLVAVLMVCFLVLAVSPALALSEDLEANGVNGATESSETLADESVGLGTGMVPAGSESSSLGAAATDEEAADTAAGLAMILMVGAGAVVIHETLVG